MEVTRTVQKVPAVRDDLFTPCDHPLAVTVMGEEVCLDAGELRSNGVEVTEGSEWVSLETLVEAGLAREFVASDETTVSEQTAEAEAGFAAMGSSSGMATCPDGNAEDHADAAGSSGSADVLLEAQIGSAGCRTEVAEGFLSTTG